MTELFSHIGAWAPKPEQNAVARYLDEYDDMVDYVEDKRKTYAQIVHTICKKIEGMKDKGFSVDCQRPEGGIYISVFLEYVNSFGSTEEYISFLINTCEQALELKAIIGADNVRIHLDTYHMNIEEKSFHAVTRRAGKDLVHYHLCENDRGIPGTGLVDWDGIFRGLAEIGLVLQGFGGQPETLYGLAGLGDLLATSYSPLSRNYRCGLLLAEGRTEAEAKESLAATVEGPRTARAALRLAEERSWHLPICEQVVAVLDGQSQPSQAVKVLMERDLKPELPR
jgi:hypothetical protein